MTMWLLAVLLIASVAALGYRQGAVRVAFSFVGIVLGALLAVPLGSLLRPLLAILGMHNQLYRYLLAPLIIFVVISILFKVAAATVHHKVDVHFKYHAGDLRLALFERLNARVGLCLGILNGVAYMILLSFVVYSLSYCTVQVASSDEDPRWMRILNRMGRDTESSGLAKVAGALDKRALWYDAADLAGVIYHNPLAEARLARYPAFLGISERPEFKELGSDKDFTELRLKRAPIMEVLEQPKAQTILENPETVGLIWTTVTPNSQDLQNYLRTGVSAKFGQERILGRWNFDPNYALAMMRRAKTNMTSIEAQKLKKWVAASFAQTSFVAMPDHQVLLKNLPQVRVPAANAPQASPTQTIQGQWKSAAGKYQLTFAGGTEVAAVIESERLKMNYEGMELAFNPED